jgi:hypothetical protein
MRCSVKLTQWHFESLGLANRMLWFTWHHGLAKSVFTLASWHLILSIDQSVDIYFSMCFSVCLIISLLIYFPASLFLYFFIYLSIRLSLYLYVFSLYLSFCISEFLSLFIYLCISIFSLSFSFSFTLCLFLSLFCSLSIYIIESSSIQPNLTEVAVRCSQDPWRFATNPCDRSGHRVLRETIFKRKQIEILNRFLLFVVF